MPRTKPPQNGPIPPAQLAVLQHLTGVGAAARGTIERAVGEVPDLDAMACAGLVTREVLELDGGLTERAWVITDAGRDAVNRSASVGRAAKPGTKGVDRPDVGALAPWFGSARRQAEQVGEACRGAKWVGVPFAGSMCEIPAILDAGANSVAVNDKHGHLINMARVLADPWLGAAMIRRLRRPGFCTEVLRAAQQQCAEAEPGDEPDLELAVAYFVSAWMSRSAEAGKSDEFRAGLAVRWGAGGGNSVLRYVNAVGGLPAWRKILQRCSLHRECAFDFLARANDRDDAAIYADPPWPDVGKGYRHAFDLKDHERLFKSLIRFSRARIVVRAGEHPVPRRLYREADGWRWLSLHGRNQGNRVSEEWLIVKRGKA